MGGNGRHSISGGVPAVDVTLNSSHLVGGAIVHSADRVVLAGHVTLSSSRDNLLVPRRQFNAISRKDGGGGGGG